MTRPLPLPAPGTRPRHPVAPPAERGFMLVGVILFVLVLTVLGLSLFSLSSIESQFFHRSRDKARAFQAAMGGIERARFAIISNGHLENVKTSLAPAGVTYAVAWQNNRDDSTGSCWNSTDPVTVRVLAEVGNDREMLEANFHPQAGAGLYKRLMSLYGELSVSTMAGSPPYDRLSYTLLNGEIRKRGPNLLGPWGPANPDVDVLATIPLPDLTGSWWTSRMALATEVNELNEGPNGSGIRNTWHLHAGAGNIRYFFTNEGPGVSADDDFSVSGTSSSPPTYFDVSGTAIWLLPRGAHFQPHVWVSGSGTLVIVARPSPTAGAGLAGLGLGFRGSIESSNVNVILVSSGDVRIEHDLGRTYDSAAIPYLSVFARDCQIMGPATPPLSSPDYLTLTHTPGDSRDGPGGIIEQLLAANALPNAGAGAGTRGTLTPIAGTWRRVTESNPN